MIRIFQIVFTDEIVDAINSQGHDGAVSQCPQYGVYLRNIRGADRYQPEDFRYYEPVAEVDTDQLFEAFTISNGMGDESRYHVLPGARPRSLSVGDIVELNGQYHIVDVLGYKEISIGVG